MLIDFFHTSFNFRNLVKTISCKKNRQSPTKKPFFDIFFAKQEQLIEKRLNIATLE